MVLHAGGGELSLEPCPEGQRFVELVARDTLREGLRFCLRHLGVRITRAPAESIAPT